jgi:hypothetical protein
MGYAFLERKRPRSNVKYSIRRSRAASIEKVIHRAVVPGTSCLKANTQPQICSMSLLRAYSVSLSTNAMPWIEFATIRT